MCTTVNNNKRINRMYLIVWKSEKSPRVADTKTPPRYLIRAFPAMLFYLSAVFFVVSPH